jgi:Ser/Thr protein kinase RdoA (MazF antagonist)
VASRGAHQEDHQMKDFGQLTNRGRALRLRRMALIALQQYDLDVKRVRLLSNDLNGIFRVDLADGQKVVLRVCLPEGGHSLPEIRSEMMWLAALSRDTGLGVPWPFANRAGALVTTVEAAGVPQARHCVVFGWMPGPDLADRLTLENVQKLGALSAQLHAHAETFEPPSDFSIKTADSVFPFEDEIVLFDDAHGDLVPPARRAVFLRARDRVEAALGDLYANREGLRVLHYDLHHWNVKVFRGKLYALDFEDLMWGYPVQDIAVTFYYWQDRADLRELREAFKNGYTEQSDWPEQAPGQIDTLIAGRGLDLANFVLQDPNPEWQQAAPAFLERVEGRLRAVLD